MARVKNGVWIVHCNTVCAAFVGLHWSFAFSRSLLLRFKMHISLQPLCKILFTQQVRNEQEREGEGGENEKRNKRQEQNAEWKGTNRTYVAGNVQSFELILWQGLTRNVVGITKTARFERTIKFIMNSQKSVIGFSFVFHEICFGISVGRYFGRIFFFVTNSLCLTIVLCLFACNKLCTPFEIRIN